MRTCLLVVFAFVVSTVMASPNLAKAEIKVSEERVGAYDRLVRRAEIKFESLPFVEANDVEPLLINGNPVNPKFFPAVFRMTTGGTCTATVIGPASLLLAAHCVDHLARISFVASGKTVSGICEQAPGYKSVDDSQDWALCLLEREVSGFAYESVDVKQIPKDGEILALMGYGCVQRGERLDGMLRIGVSTVVDKPANWPDETSTIYTKSDLLAGEAVLCPGDSGGPLYRLTGDFNDARQVVGVNSRTTYEYGVSLFSATASVAGATFLARWVDRHNQKICGVNLVEGCR